VEQEVQQKHTNFFADDVEEKVKTEREF